MVDAMKGKQEDLAKTYDFFRRINFYSPTPPGIADEGQ